MTIAEKLTKIAENEQKVYDAGYERGYHDGEIVGGGSYDQGFEDGKQAEYDAFWGAYQPNTSIEPYQFSSTGWNDNNFFPKRDMIATSNAYGAFYSIGVTDLVKRLNDCGRKIDTSKASKISALFQYAYRLTTVPKISAMSASDATNIFGDCQNLKKIECLEVHAAITYSNTFYRCQALENITIEGEIGNDINFQWSTLLTEASIRSIVSHLSDAASGKTLTLSKTAADREFPTWYENENGEWVNAGCGGNGEWLELIAPKVENGKWIIDLV
jgi:hypothetical protein